MTKLVKNIKIYESIADPVMTAVITVSDAIGLAESFPIIGEEYIEMDLETPGMGDIFTFKFDVVNLKDRKTLAEDKASVYNLYCVSTEMRKNTRPMAKVYNEISTVDVVQKVIEELGTEKALNTADGVYSKVDINLNKLRPFQAIDKARLLTHNTMEQSSAFCFFENKQGFNFLSVEQMFERGKTNIGDRIFFFDSAPGRSIYTNDFRQIIGMTHLTETASLAGMMGGQLNAKIKTFDLITGEVADKQYRDSESSSGFIYADDDSSSLRSSSGQVEDGEDEAQTIFNVVDSTKNDPNLQEMYLERSSYVHKLIQQIFKMEIYGDLAISAGDVIEVNMPMSSGLTDDVGKLDPRFGGNFLVARLVNNISLMGSRPVHSLTCELIKGNFT